MGVTALEEIMESLGKLPENRMIPVTIIENATRAGQRIIKGTVTTIAQVARTENLQAPALIFVGEVGNYLK